MATLFRRKKKPKTEEEQLIKDYKKVEKSTRALSTGIKSWKQSQLNLCKGTNKLSTTLKRIGKIGVNPSLLVRSVDLITTYRHKMLDLVQLTTQDSIQRLHSLFSNMQEATKKRDQAKREVEQLKKKVDKYYSQYPIPIEKYKNAVKLHKESVAKQQQTHDNYIQDLRIICKGKNEFFQPCLESLLLSQIVLYQRIWRSIEPVIQEKEKQETLAIRPHLEKIKALDIVSGPKTDVKQKLQAKRNMETMRRQTCFSLSGHKAKAPTPPQESPILEYPMSVSPKSGKSRAAPPTPPSIATIPRTNDVFKEPVSKEYIPTSRNRARSLKSKAPSRPISFPSAATPAPDPPSAATPALDPPSTAAKKKAPCPPVRSPEGLDRRSSLHLTGLNNQIPHGSLKSRASLSSQSFSNVESSPISISPTFMRSPASPSSSSNNIPPINDKSQSTSYVQAIDAETVNSGTSVAMLSNVDDEVDGFYPTHEEYGSVTNPGSMSHDQTSPRATVTLEQNDQTVQTFAAASEPVPTYLDNNKQTIYPVPETPEDVFLPVEYSDSPSSTSAPEPSDSSCSERSAIGTSSATPSTHFSSNLIPARVVPALNSAHKGLRSKRAAPPPPPRRATTLDLPASNSAPRNTEIKAAGQPHRSSTISQGLGALPPGHVGGGRLNQLG